MPQMYCINVKLNYSQSWSNFYNGCDKNDCDMVAINHGDNNFSLYALTNLLDNQTIVRKLFTRIHNIQRVIFGIINGSIMNSKANSDKINRPARMIVWIFSNNSVSQRQICQLWYNDASEEQNITESSGCAIPDREEIYHNCNMFKIPIEMIRTWNRNLLPPSIPHFLQETWKRLWCKTSIDTSTDIIRNALGLTPFVPSPWRRPCSLPDDSLSVVRSSHRAAPCIVIRIVGIRVSVPFPRVYSLYMQYTKSEEDNGVRSQVAETEWAIGETP